MPKRAPMPLASGQIIHLRLPADAFMVLAGSTVRGSYPELDPATAQNVAHEREA